MLDTDPFFRKFILDPDSYLVQNILYYKRYNLNIKFPAYIPGVYILQNTILVVGGWWKAGEVRMKVQLKQSKIKGENCIKTRKYAIKLHLFGL